MYCEYRLRHRPAPSTQSSQIIVCFLGAGEFHLRQTYVIGSPAGEHFLRPECSTWLYSLAYNNYRSTKASNWRSKHRWRDLQDKTMFFFSRRDLPLIRVTSTVVCSCHRTDSHAVEPWSLRANDARLPGDWLLVGRVFGASRLGCFFFTDAGRWCGWYTLQCSILD